MASRVSTGSPRMNRKSTPTMKVSEEAGENGKTPRKQSKTGNTAIPLQTSTLVNLPATRFSGNASSGNDNPQQPDINDMLNRLRLNDSRKQPTSEVKRQSSQPKYDVLEKLMVHLDDQTKTLRQQEADLRTDSERGSIRDLDRSSGSELFTPATENFEDPIKADPGEIERVKKELEEAKSVISRQQQELDETRTFKHTMDQAMDPPSETDFPCTGQAAGNLQSSFNASARPFTSQGSSWLSDDSHIDDLAGNHSASGQLSRSRMSQVDQISGSTQMNAYGQVRDTRMHVPDYSAIYAPQSQLDVRYGTNRALPQNTTSFSSLPNHTFGADSFPGATILGRGSGAPLRSETVFNTDSLSPGVGFATPSLAHVGSVNISGSGHHYLTNRNLGLACSPINELNVGAAAQAVGAGFCQRGNAQTYVTPLEPMNYRRLLDKSVSCDWKYIVDKIVCNNDQQASIFLQQKLKVGTAEQKFEIVEAIINQAYPLMINRFGNFLVQRCFEHGTPEQVVAIANAIHGNVISLSMDPFGCHVVQKAFDSIPENHKADMVRELLRRIPDTVIHRYACHVWQKLFELRWSGEPPQIMTKVNEALKGMWHEVALGETGSLVVQNIFENCVEEEKRPAIEEVICNIDLIAHGQFGNWCIQHLCEHGSPPDKRRVIDHILTNAYNYSIDQYASKVVEKCLKIGGIEFLDRYLNVITTSHPDRPRIPLIDIAGDQYGNYLIQWILMNTHQHQREQVAIHIRKHMVSLRGSKFGSRVAMLCCNPASTTRPGPGALVNPFGAPGQPRTSWNRLR